MLPATVPRLRTWVSPMPAAISDTSGLSRNTSGEAATAPWVARAPMRIILLADADALQVGDAANVDDRRRAGQAQLHQGDEAVAPGQQLGIGIGLQQLDGLGHRAGLVIVKICGEHDVPPSSLADEWPAKPAAGSEACPVW